MRDHLFRLWGGLLCLAALVFVVTVALAAATTPGERPTWEPWLLGSLALLAIGFVSMLIDLHLTKRLTEDEKRAWHRRMWIGLLLGGVYFLQLGLRRKQESATPDPHPAP